MYSGRQGLCHCVEAAEITVRDGRRHLAFERVEHCGHAARRLFAGGREVDHKGAAVVAIELAAHEVPLLEPVENVRQRGAFSPEIMVQRSDRGWTESRELREDVRLGLRDSQLGGGVLHICADQVGGTFNGCQHYTHTV